MIQQLMCLHGCHANRIRLRVTAVAREDDDQEH